MKTYTVTTEMPIRLLTATDCGGPLKQLETKWRENAIARAPERATRLPHWMRRIAAIAFSLHLVSSCFSGPPQSVAVNNRIGISVRNGICFHRFTSTETNE